jgi:radical SAM superfamily enzyme YgiQ (UPF0313 family)
MRVLLVDFNPFSPPVTPISTGYIGAALEARGHEVRVLGLGATSTFSEASFSRFVEEFRPRLAGFGTYQRNIFHVRSLAALVKRAAPGCSVILGGPQATFMPDEALEALPDVDYLCRGEGEVVMTALAESLESESTGGAVAGATGRDGDGGYLTGPAIAPAEELDDYPSPWLSGVLDPAGMDESIMLTSRGCPYSCSFCYTPAAFGRAIRTHSVERVVDEIAYVSERGSGRLWFADPNFSFNGSRVVEILEAVARRGLARPTQAHRHLHGRHGTGERLAERLSPPRQEVGPRRRPQGDRTGLRCRNRRRAVLAVRAAPRAARGCHGDAAFRRSRRRQDPRQQ